VVATLPVWMAVFCRNEALRRRYLLAFLCCWIVNGTLVAGVFMSGGPAFHALLGADPQPFADLLAYLQQLPGPFSVVEEQRILWQAYLTEGPTVGAGISAFPSLHVTMAVLSMLAAWRLNRWLGIALSLFAAVIIAGSIHLGWHYAVDGYVGALLTLVIWAVAGWTSIRTPPASPGRP